ncbi:flavin-binding monooxygenase-like protein [Grosmannia clavigera kw1407]|uniref:Flavin-binding monooxygenase-like protein n=1 Tax=Grosmannia clavigera (strain kw1407 / UAMH 11150) TaxID=655863 RepID=F0XV71_GROCL|nr:flavin-binding monooxygenase-like protein [Grosmannia clavigera kw1407]EFW98549.1 flavin-binding monooxygenase-like protein [Grosmannia clavigera kw1407]
MISTSDVAEFAAKLPHDNRIEAGSVNILPADFPVSVLPGDAEPVKVAANVVANINDRLTTGDYDGLAALFANQGAWRDHLGLSWDLRTLQGPAKIAEFLWASGHGTSLKNVRLDESAPNRTPAIAGLDPDGRVPCVLLYVTFAAKVGSGRGIIRMIHDGSTWKIITFYTALRELTGFEEPLGDRRPQGASHGGGRNMRNWAEQRADDESFVNRDPAVLVIGAGQGGLTSAARLRMLQVPTLVVDREQRVGDNWRGRYRQLVLHDPVWYDHLPYLEFPSFWPVFTPKDKLADFFESYVRLLELNVWTHTEVKSLQYDAAKKRYDVTLRRQHVGADGTTPATETRTFHPRHVIQATGHSGKKNIPGVPGMDAFVGRLWHSSEFPGATPQPETTNKATTKRRAVVVGACNSGHDIAQDFYENGYDVTIVQRSSTYVVSSKAIVNIGLGGLYSEAAQRRVPCDDADLLLWSRPTALAKAADVQVAQRSAEHDADLLQKLQAVGFRLDRGTNGAGLMYKYFQRGGGYYIDVGASQLVVEGKIKIRSGQEVTKVLSDGLVLADGTHLPADEIVFATGYQNMRTQTSLLFGDALADRCSDVWGFDSEGEFRTMWRRSGQPGFWFMGGNLALSRHFSRFLALQIKAQEEGLSAYE